MKCLNDLSESLAEFRDLPGVSVVICTFNGKQRLKPTLEHALRQIFSYPYEILVVNNASTDGTAGWVKELAILSDFKGLIRVVSEHKPGLSHARLRGVFEARFSIILFCDDKLG
ncbi:MAG: hypothetical protein B7Z16_18900 [Algoriphagus sp. 32-45-6]|nr:MAG: hypothetical protein B7Z16_18900 [Algoriphagus sp. 32-45-6]